MGGLPSSSSPKVKVTKMIVSGFPQQDRLPDEEDQHSHCMKCRKVNCVEFAACVMGKCELCQWRCHQCKMSEHTLTCPEHKVPCLNQGYGCPLLMKRSKLAFHLSSCPASVIVCMEAGGRRPNFRRDEFKWHYQNVHQDIEQGVHSWLLHRCPLAYLGCPFSVQRFTPAEPTGTIFHSLLHESFAFRRDTPSLPPRSRSKSTKERDHDSPQNISGNSGGLHNDMTDGLNSCQVTDSSDHLKKSENTSQDQPSISDLANFDKDFDDSSSTADCLSLLDLPFTVLQHIGRRLDSYSLCNLALSNRLLRDVCCSLLEEEGIVVLHWERHKAGSQVSWRVARKHWMFSTWFEPIRRWKLAENKQNIGDHMKECAFNKDVVIHQASLMLNICQDGPDKAAVKAC